ncbi:hypothetical protein PR048_015008 [Dryococelus australis]|uniref:Uncharacterized protein n=1 Tax=Dryococelus australis TaxID=614101 RepID=A0ABQ9HFS3_9NEOP|nr:hypothetical protein PR048_015008 [Dryococelus australis]
MEGVGFELLAPTCDNEVERRVFKGEAGYYQRVYSQKLRLASERNMYCLYLSVWLLQDMHETIQNLERENAHLWDMLSQARNNLAEVRQSRDQDDVLQLNDTIGRLQEELSRSREEAEDLCRQRNLLESELKMSFQESAKLEEAAHQKEQLELLLQETRGGSCGAVASALASHLDDPGSIPGGFAPACRRSFSGYSRFLRPSILAPLHPKASLHVLLRDDGHLRVPACKPADLQSDSESYQSVTKMLGWFCHLYVHDRAAVAERIACSPPTKANRVQSPAGSVPDFRIWESCHTMALGSPVSPALSFRRCYILNSIILIGSQDLGVKSHPNLFTHSCSVIEVFWCTYHKAATSKNNDSKWGRSSPVDRAPYSGAAVAQWVEEPYSGAAVAQWEENPIVVPHARLKGKPQENSPTSGIVRHDSHWRKLGVNRAGLNPEKENIKLKKILDGDETTLINRKELEGLVEACTFLKQQQIICKQKQMESEAMCRRLKIDLEWMGRQDDCKKTRLSELNSENAKLLKDLKTCDAECAVLKRRLNKRDVEIQNMKTSQANCQDSLDELRKNYAIANERFNDTETRLDQTKGKLLQLLKETEVTKNKLDEQVARNVSIQKNLNEEKIKYTHLENELKKLKTKYVRTQNKLDEVEIKYHNNEKSSEKVREICIHQMKLLNETEIDYIQTSDRLSEEREIRSKVLRQTTSEFVHVMGLLSDSEEQCFSKTKDLEKQELEIAGYKHTIKGLECLRDEKQRLLQGYQQKYQEASKRLEEMYSELTYIKNKLKAFEGERISVTNLQPESSKAVSNVHKLDLKTEDEKIKVLRLTNEHENDNTLVINQMMEITAVEDSLKVILREKEDALISARKELYDTQEQLTCSRARLAVIESELLALRNKLDGLELAERKYPLTRHEEEFEFEKHANMPREYVVPTLEQTDLLDDKPTKLLRDLANANQDMEATITQLKVERSIKSKELNELLTELAQFREVKQQHTGKMKELNELKEELVRISETGEEYSRKIEELNHLNKVHQLTLKELSKIDEECAAARKKLCDMEQVCACTKNQLEATAAACAAATEELAEKSASCDLTNKKLAKINVQHHNITKKLEEMKAKRKCVLDDITTLQSQYDYATNELYDLDNEHREARDQINVTEAEIESLREQLTEKETELSSVQQTLANTQDEYAATRGELEERVAQYAVMREDLCEMKVEYNHVNEELTHVECEYISEKEELNKIKEEYSKTSDILCQTKANNDYAKEQLSILVDETDYVNEQISEKEFQLINAKQLLNQLQTELTASLNQIDYVGCSDNTRQLEREHKDLSILKHELEEATCECLRVKALHCALEEQYALAVQHIHELERKYAGTDMSTSRAAPLSIRFQSNVISTMIEHSEVTAAEGKEIVRVPGVISVLNEIPPVDLYDDIAELQSVEDSIKKLHCQLEFIVENKCYFEDEIPLMIDQLTRKDSMLSEMLNEVISFVEDMSVSGADCRSLHQESQRCYDEVTNLWDQMRQKNIMFYNLLELMATLMQNVLSTETDKQDFRDILDTLKTILQNLSAIEEQLVQFQLLGEALTAENDNMAVEVTSLENTRAAEVLHLRQCEEDLHELSALLREKQQEINTLHEYLAQQNQVKQFCPH